MSNSTTTRWTDQLDSLGQARDEADLEALYGVFTVLAPSIYRGLQAGKGTPEAQGAGLLNKTLRMLIVNLWQEPRFPGSGVRPKMKMDHNKPFVFPWSAAARDLYFEKRANPSLSTANKLVLEHTHPAKILADDLLKLIREGSTQEQWTKFFLEAHRGLSFVVLTKEEDNQLTGVGLRSAVVDATEDASPLARYIKAGIGGEFMGITEDPRWGGSSAAQ